MLPMPIVDLLARGRELAARGERVSVLAASITAIDSPP
jgi:hypothetical protein